MQSILNVHFNYDGAVMLSFSVRTYNTGVVSSNPVFVTIGKEGNEKPPNQVLIQNRAWSHKIL